MKILNVIFLLLSLTSCSHPVQREDRKSPPWFALYNGNNIKRTPAHANTDQVKELESFIEAFLKVALRKEVPVGSEKIVTSFIEGKTEITREVYLKQNEHGYFAFDPSDEVLSSHNFETDYKKFIAGTRESLESGQLTEIKQVKEGVYLLKGTSEDNSCRITFDFNRLSLVSECVNSKGETISKKDIVYRVVDLSIYENKLRKSTITICSNVLSTTGGTICESSSSESDWWAFLFEETK